MAVAVVACMVLHLLLPPQLRLGSAWILAVLVIVLLVALIVGDPGRIDRRTPWLGIVTGVMIGMITAINTWSALRLVDGILHANTFPDPDELLLFGGIVWITNAVAFALWYWDLDGGGSAERFHGTGPTPSFVFPEMEYPEYVGEGWYPRFIDYLTFSFATAMAFSPTDVSAIKPWAKVLCLVESIVSLALAALVIARAINILQ
ncbi:MAG: hypothetical protein RLZ55_1768 [Actinomycetota bacterium]|jgi:uncharacterized membrane protein